VIVNIVKFAFHPSRYFLFGLGPYKVYVPYHHTRHLITGIDVTWLPHHWMPTVWHRPFFKFIRTKTNKKL